MRADKKREENLPILFSCILYFLANLGYKRKGGKIND